METLACAKILSCYGIRGELKVKSLSGETDHFFKMKEVYIERHGLFEKYLIEGIKEANRWLIIKLEGVDNPEAAKKFLGLEMRVDRRMSCPRGKDEYYCADLVQYVVTRESGQIGKVKSIIECGSRSVLEIEGESGTITMIPFMKQFMKKVDVESRTILLSSEADIF